VSDIRGSVRLMAGPVEGRLTELAREVLSEMGCELYHLEYHPAGSKSLVRVYIEKDGGVRLDDCEAASRRFGAVLEVEDLIPNSYVLEVSSPGLDRPLFEEKDYRRFAGRPACLTTREPLGGRRRFRGTIISCEQGEVRLGLAEGEDVLLPLSAVASGRLEVECGRNP